MRINVVLVDYENVKDLDLRDLKRDDVRVIVFLGSNQEKVPTQLALQMQSLGERGEYVQMSGAGPNALDFHIAFTIGEMCTSSTPQFFHIISGDLGFDPLLAYLKRKKIFAARHKKIADMPFLKAAQPQTASERAASLIEKLSRPAATRPRAVKTLTNSLRTIYRDLPDKDVQDVIEIMKAKGFIEVTGDKVIYPSK